jgi:hypothetical protein
MRVGFRRDRHLVVCGSCSNSRSSFVHDDSALHKTLKLFNKLKGMYFVREKHTASPSLPH